MRYTEYGTKSGPLLVFLHGGGIGGWMWDKQVEYFRPNYHCLVPELLEPDQPFSISSAADGVIELISERAEGKRVIIIGFSLGAQVAVALLAKKPNAVDSAMINSALVKPIPFSKCLDAVLSLSLPLVRNKAFARLQAKSMYVEEEHFNRYYKESCRISAETFRTMFQENMAFHIPASFEQARANMLITVGAREKSVMKQSMKELVHSQANSIGCMIPRVGHGLPLADPDRFNRLAEHWMQTGEIHQDEGLIYHKKGAEKDE